MATEVPERLSHEEQIRRERRKGTYDISHD